MKKRIKAQKKEFFLLFVRLCKINAMGQCDKFLGLLFLTVCCKHKPQSHRIEIITTCRAEIITLKNMSGVHCNLVVETYSNQMLLIFVIKCTIFFCVWQTRLYCTRILIKKIERRFCDHIDFCIPFQPFILTQLKIV